MPGEGTILAEDVQETDGIGWLTLAEAQQLPLFPDFRRQITRLLSAPQL
jgi:hypothetical protein